MLEVKISPQKYRSYLPSGADCFKAIPAHWFLVPLGSFSQVIDPQPDHRAPAMDVNGFPYIGIRDIREDGTLDFSSARFVSEVAVSKQEAAFTVNEGDILFCKVGTLGEPRHVRLDGSRFALSATLVLIKIGCDFLNKFSKYVLESDFLDAQISPMLTGATRPALGIQQIRKFSIPRPPYGEVVEIVNYLDKKVSLIDQAIALKNKQVALFKERKRILIQQVVTRGLDPHVPLKDSGIEWIGKVPVHWKLKKVRYLGTTQNGISAGADFFGHGYPFVSYSDVYNNDQLPGSVSGLANASVGERNQYSIERGDVLFKRTSETIEEIGFASTCFHKITDSTFAGFLIRFRPKTNTLFEGYSKYYFNAPMLRAYFVKEMSIVTRASLSQQLLKNMPVLLPPIAEQKEIHAFLERESENLNRLIEIHTQQIKNLKEYKATLINSAVTGKIKVPGVVEPTEIEEREIA